MNLIFSRFTNKSIAINQKIFQLVFYLFGLPHLATRIRLYLLIKNISRYNIVNRKILDAGYGFSSIEMARHKATVVGIDSDKRKLVTAKRICYLLSQKVKFQYASIYKLPYQNNSFDFLACLEVLEHLDRDKQAVKELTKVVKPGGKLLVSFPANIKTDPKILRRLGHVRSGYTIKDFQRISPMLTISKIATYGNNFITKKLLYIEQQISQMSLPLAGIFSLITFPMFLPELNSRIDNPYCYFLILTKRSSKTNQ